MRSKLILGFFSAAMLAVSSFGQTAGNITGVVTDSSGSLIAGATITVANPQTNLTRETASNNTGNYNFPELPPGLYTVRAERQGFQSEVRSAIELQVQQTARIDFRLNVGAVTETVEVAGGAPLLNTENATVGTVIEQKRIEDLPLNGRNFISLVALSPNVTTGQIANSGQAAARSGGDRAKVSLSIAGMRRAFTYFSLDGVSNTDVDFVTYTFLPSIDSLDEFKVQTGIYSAEFGREAAQVNISTKSGTNQYHGALFEFIRNNKLDALPFAFTSQVPVSAPFKWNQYGFTLGGPVQIPKVFNGANRLFFMSSYEGFKLRNQAQTVYSDPSAAMDAGNFSQLLPTTVIKDPTNNGVPFPGNIIPTQRLSPVSQKLLQFIPTPNIGSGLVNNYLALQNNTTDKDQFLQRIDFIENSKSSWFGRYNWGVDSSYSPTVGQAANNVNTTVKMAMIANTRILTPSLVNEARFGYMGYHNNVLGGLAYKTNVIGELNLPVTQSQDPIAWGIPSISIQGYSGFGDSNQGPFQANDHTFQWIDGLSWTHGNHSLKFGAEIRRDRYNTLGNMGARGTYAFQNQATGYGMSDFMLGYIQQSQVAAELASARLRATSQYYYATDSWKVRPNLTIDAGLRYEYTPVWNSLGDNMIQLVVPSMQPRDFQPNAPYNDIPYFIRDCAAYDQTQFYAPNSIVRFDQSIPTKCDSSLGTVGQTNDRANFAPRLGIAWSPKANWTVRAGAGIFFTQDIGSMYFDLARTAAGRSVAQSDPTHFLPWSNPLGVAPGANACGVSTPPYVCIVSPFTYTNEPHRRTPYVFQSELNIQRQLTKTMVLELGYLGSEGHFLQRIALFDGATPGAGSILARQPWPQFNANQYIAGTGNSNYNSGTVKLTRRMSNGLSALVGYTWSKSNDTGSSVSPEDGSFNTKPQTGWCMSCEYGLSDFDTRHRFVASILYELPFGKGKQFLNNGGPVGYILGGWQLNSIITKSSGFPIMLQDGINQANTNINVDRPNAVYGVSPHLDNPSPNQWFNIDSVQVQPFGTFGNVGRNTIISPGIFSWDFSTLKNFNITERAYLQFRFECFNCANHPNFGYPGNTLAANLRNAQGLAIPGTGTFGQISSLLPGIAMRQLQFSLKLIF